MMDEGRASGQDGQDGRALVLYDPRPLVGEDRPLTDFLTQLIACDRQLPPYRRARKAEPNAAASAYATEPVMDPLGHFDRRV